MTHERRSLIEQLETAPLQVLNSIKVSKELETKLIGFVDIVTGGRDKSTTFVSNCIRQIEYYLQTEHSAITAKELVEEWQKEAYNADCQATGGGTVNSSRYSKKELEEIAHLTYIEAAKELDFNFQF